MNLNSYDTIECVKMNEINTEGKRAIKIPEKTFEFLTYLARQDVTLPAVLVHYLKWNRYTSEEIKEHFQALNCACIRAQP